MVRNAVASKGGVAGEEGRSRSGTPSRKRLLTESERLEEEERKKGLRRKAVAAMGVTIIVGLLILLIVFLVAYGNDGFKGEMNKKKIAVFVLQKPLQFTTLPRDPFQHKPTATWEVETPAPSTRS